MEPLKHECGVAMIRLLKPLEYYQRKYGSWMYGLQKLYLLMEKQHNRGQEGAGLACLKMDAAPGEEYMFRERALGSGAITEIFDAVNKQLSHYTREQIENAQIATRELPFAGEIYMGHLRYSTTKKSGISFVHPFLRRNNWRAKNLCLCGNFNLTNVPHIFQEITSKGQHPRINSDTYIMLELMGHRLDRESERLYQEAIQKGLEGCDITHYIEEHIDIANVLKTSTPLFDGGYVICGMTGSGEMIAMRDPWGIRTAFYYHDDEVVVVASERPVIQTAFNLTADQVHELKPGEAIKVRNSGEISMETILPSITPMKACSFERIYFSRGNDKDIYQEREMLGFELADRILEAVGGDIDHTVCSFIPNTAEVAFYGLIRGLEQRLNKEKQEVILSLKDREDSEKIQKILQRRVRSCKVAWKDIKLRTFIAAGADRTSLAAHVYDITYGSLQKDVDNLVVIDDSIVRGTTLREQIISILGRLSPRQIVIVSSSPQVRYPDYYGIDMSSMEEFIAFRAAMELLWERGMWHVATDVYNRCKEQLSRPLEERINCVKGIYAHFTEREISRKIAEMLTPESVGCKVSIVYQSLEGLHKACPQHCGDWYFSGDYPTPGGTTLVMKSYMDYYEKNARK